jgi:hypothetical protein
LIVPDTPAAFPLLAGTFTIKFKREFILCCFCLQQRWRRRRGLLSTNSDKGGGGGGDNGTFRTALLYSHRSHQRSSSSGSIRNERASRNQLSSRGVGMSPSFSGHNSSTPSYPHNPPSTPFSSCRMMPMYPLCGGGGGGNGSIAASDLSTECSRMSLNSLGRDLPPPDRANINNFVRSDF